MHAHNLWHLPEAPGTVIAIGKWWLVRLEPHNGTGPGCWELLPARDEETSRSMKRAGVKDQCVYGDEWVLAEAEQEGGYLVVATAEQTWYGPTMRNVFPQQQERAQADPLPLLCRCGHKENFHVEGIGCSGSHHDSKPCSAFAPLSADVVTPEEAK